MTLRRGLPVFLAAAALLSDVSGRTRGAPSFADRVAAQTAIERVYYSHQIGATRPFEEAVPRQWIERKVRDTLRKSVALETIWNSPVTAAALERELQRIVSVTRLPRRLHEIYRALENDPVLVRECFVRPILVDRLARSFYGSDRETSFDEWWMSIEETLDPSRMETPDVFSGPLPQPGDHPDFAPQPDPCQPEGAWDAGGLDLPPGARAEHDGIWTGNVVVIWGGSQSQNSGGRYDPLTDTWTAMSRHNAPIFSSRHTAVWTGSEMLVWGSGSLGSGLGGRYDPVADVWIPIPTSGTLTGRSLHSAVWTGTRMIVWGGYDLITETPLASGDVYDPATDTWTTTSMTGAPPPRAGHSAVWTGSRMVIWGGADDTTYFNTGGRYDPATDTWSATLSSTAPPGRSDHAAYWTGNVMLVWGGGDASGALASGGRYDPSADSWSPVTATGAPPPVTGPFTAWTGSRLMVWGGLLGTGVLTNSGALYDPVADAWTPTSTTAAPGGRWYGSATWTGDSVVVWGGEDDGSLLNTGGRYNPAMNSWTPTSTANRPRQRTGHTAVWTGTEMIVWGGQAPNTDLSTGARYDPLTGVWTPTSSINAPSARHGHTAVWTGSTMVVWGGVSIFGSFPQVGGRYDPVSDTWSPMPVGLSGRERPTAVWTGRWVIYWGGTTGGAPPTPAGSRYDPALNIWSPFFGSTADATNRAFHSAVWTGRVMILWGGSNNESAGQLLNTGARYDPALDVWTTTSTVNAPGPRSSHSAIWTGARMIVWGGFGASPGSILNTGASYNPFTNEWTPITTAGAPPPRWSHTAVWTGDRMVVWGGRNNSDQVDTGGQYDPAVDAWTPTSMVEVPEKREGHTAVWTGDAMIVWGGFGNAVYDSGSYYLPAVPNLDPDGDGVSDCVDNCLDVANPLQEDGDVDGAGDVCDCAPADSGSFGPPDSSLLFLSDASTLTWSDIGSSTVRSVARGSLVELPFGSGPSEVCLASDFGDASLTDPDIPSMQDGFWYLQKGSNACGTGSWGQASDGTPRVIGACP